MLHHEMQKINYVQLSEWPWSLKKIDGELWSCQQDGITVYDEELKMLRVFKAHGDYPWVYSVALLPDDTAVVAGGGQLYQSYTSGWFYFLYWSCLISYMNEVTW